MDAPFDDPSQRIRAYFDEFAEREWDRLAGSTRGKVSFELHRRMLLRWMPVGRPRVLEIGAGPGRFTLELASLDAIITVTDISEVQLGLNARKVSEAGGEAAVAERFALDICDLRRFHDGQFDAVVAYGGPMSYAFEQAEAAFGNLLRIIRPGGVVFASVMSTLGTARLFLRDVVDLMHTKGNDEFFRSGDTRFIDVAGHVCRMFRWRELQELFDHSGCQLLEASASNWLSMGDSTILAPIVADPSQWKRFVDREEELARESGAIDGGTHILFAVRRPDA